MGGDGDGMKSTEGSKSFRLLDGDSDHYDVMILQEPFDGVVVKITKISLTPADGTYLDPSLLDDSVETKLSYTYDIKNPDFFTHNMEAFDGDYTDQLNRCVGDIIIEILEESFDTGDYHIGRKEQQQQQQQQS